MVAPAGCGRSAGNGESRECGGDEGCKSGRTRRPDREETGAEWRRLNRAVIAWCFVITLAVPAAGAAPDAGQTSFSALNELTPQNVRGLMPLSWVSVAGSQGRRSSNPPIEHSIASVGASAAVDSSGAVDLRIMRFIADRIRRTEFTTPGSLRTAGLADEVTYTRASGQLTARELLSRRPMWITRERLPISCGTLVTAGGLVFYGSADGWFKALDARTGRDLWKHRIGGATLTEPVSYLGPDGHQYVAVLSALGDSPGTLHAFSLPR